MAATKIIQASGWLSAVILCLGAVSSAPAQTILYPVYGPWGVYYLRAYAPVAPAYAAAPSSPDSRPSYYSEDYAGPEGPKTEPSKVAYIRVRVPANAEVWINSDKRKQKGTVREFVTPALDPDHIYVYNVKARWTEEGGINVEKTLRVRTISGTRVTVNFARPPAQPARQTAPTAVAATSQPMRSETQVERKPVDFISNAAPRSLRGPNP